MNCASSIPTSRAISPAASWSRTMGIASIPAALSRHWPRPCNAMAARCCAAGHRLQPGWRQLARGADPGRRCGRRRGGDRRRRAFQAAGRHTWRCGAVGNRARLPRHAARTRSDAARAHLRRRCQIRRHADGQWAALRRHGGIGWPATPSRTGAVRASCCNRHRNCIRPGAEPIPRIASRSGWGIGRVCRTRCRCSALRRGRPTCSTRSATAMSA